MHLPFQKSLAALVILISASCAPVKKTTPSNGTDLSAAPRQEALVKIKKSLETEPIVRNFAGPDKRGWQEVYTVLKVEEVSTQMVENKKKQMSRQMTCRITTSISRWNTYKSQRVGEPDIRQKVITRDYAF